MIDGPQDRAYIEELERKVAVLTRLVEVNTVLNAALLSTTPRIEALLGYIMDAAAEITGSEAASVLLWKHTTQELFFAATTTTTPQSQALIGKPVPLDSIAGTILKERRMVQVDDAMTDPRHYNKVDQEIQFVTRSLLGVPMISKTKVIGVLEVVNKRQLPWTEDDRANLSILAEEAAVVIEVAQMMLAMQKANQELSELDKLKSDFIAIASHELRTPLGIILGYASFLQTEAKDPEYSQHASKVMASALQLRRIIEDMVNLRYLKQNQAELYLEEMSLIGFLQDLRNEMLTLTEANEHKFEVIIPEEDVNVRIDRGRMTMAVTNILNNAARFTPPGGRIVVESQVRGGREVWISVTDNGRGIEAGNLERIFEEFYQIEDHMTRQHGGLGIGLSITRALVQAHGGRVWAESAGLGQGTTFIVSLPL
jgi:signal transduction histidine kinase